MKLRIDIFILIALAALLLNGCGSSQEKPWDTLENCKEKNTELSLQVQTLQTLNDQLTEQVTTLSALDSKNRLAAISTLEEIRIGKRTGFYDKDNNGTNETLVVYLEPIDTAQDTIKAVGQALIELWDLNVPENNAKLAERTIEPDELHQTWGGNIFDSYYRIKLPLEITPEPGKEYTLKITFTDYLGGKVLTCQQVIAVGR